MRLLVCGGAGFIGSNFVHFMLESYQDLLVITYDKLTYAGNLDNLMNLPDPTCHSFIQGDIIDLKRLNEVIQEYEITHVINFAAETHVDRSIYNGMKEFTLTNTLGVQTLLDAARLNGIQKFINVSTDEVYGSLSLEEEVKFTEKTPIWPNMPYAAAKAGGDLLCNAYWMTHHVPVIVTHCSNNYGPFQFPEKLIPFFVLKLLQGERVPLYGDGLHVRDWIHVRDHAKALDLLLRHGEPGEVYNIGCDNERSNLEITTIILKILGYGEEMIEYVVDRPGHDRRYAIDATKIRGLGWVPDYSRENFEQGLRETIDWYKSNTGWLERLWQRKRHEMNVFQDGLPHFRKSTVSTAE